MPFMDAGAAVEIEVNARFAEGFASGLEEKIRGNCEALKAKKFGFS